MVSLGRVPTELMRSVVRRNSTQYEITRVDSRTRSSVGDVQENTSTHNVDLYIFDGTERTVQYPHGEQLLGTFDGLALPDADVQDRDHVTHGDYEYEIEVEGLPNDHDPQLLALSLTRDQ